MDYLHYSFLAYGIIITYLLFSNNNKIKDNTLHFTLRNWQPLRGLELNLIEIINKASDKTFIKHSEIGDIELDYFFSNGNYHTQCRIQNSTSSYLNLSILEKEKKLTNAINSLVKKYNQKIQLA